jgi:radical SAM protein with 4Fe4S-binding SPASM domain
MKQIPVKGENYFYSNGQKQLQKNFSFGDIHTDSLNTIWHRKEYRQFVQSFQKDKAPDSCRNCLKGNIDNRP